MLHDNYTKLNMELTGYRSEGYTSTPVMRAQVRRAEPNGTRSCRHPIEVLLALWNHLLESNVKALRFSARLPLSEESISS